MTWRNHRISTFALAFAVTGGFLFSIIATIASTLPDRLELGGLIKHRTATHFWGWPTIGVLLILLFLKVHSVVLVVLLGLLFGYTAHLFEDSLSKSGVPIVSPYGKKYGMGLYVTGTTSETIAMAVLVFVAAALAAHKGYLQADHLKGAMGEIKAVFKFFQSFFSNQPV